MTLKYPILAVIFFFSSLLMGQKESNIWYLGNGQGIDFNNQYPVAIFDLGTIFWPTVIPSTICDSMGNEVLFSNHVATRNGKKKNEFVSGLLDTVHFINNYTIPNPIDKDEYFVFSSGRHRVTDQDGNVRMKGTCRYQKLRFTGHAKDSLIQVNPAQEFLQLEGFIAGYRSINNDFYWVAVYAPITGRLYIHKLTENGLASPTKVYWIDTTGYGPEIVTATNNWNAITFSSDGSLLAFSNIHMRGINLCNFDQTTGTISGLRRISDAGSFFLEFSPSGKFVYVMNTYGNGIYQCRTQFSNSISLLDSGFANQIGEGYGNALIGPDKKIYLGNGNPNLDIGVIHFPDKPGFACGFDTAGVVGVQGYLPRYVLSNTSKPKIWSSGYCLRDSTKIELFNLEADSAMLDWGDGSSIAVNKANYTHLFPTEGSYILRYIYFRGGVADTFEHALSIHELNKVDLGQDTLLCTNSPIFLDASDPLAEAYLWNGGQTSSFMTVSNEGVYSVLVKNGKCQRSDTIRIREVECEFQIVGNCFGDTSRFQSLALSADSVSWDFGDGTMPDTDNFLATHRYSDSGTYSCKLTLYKDGLQRSETQIIQIIKVSVPKLGPDTLICDLEEYVIDAQNPVYTDYLWSNGDSTANISLMQTTTIGLRAGRSGCFAYDSAKVYFVDCTIKADSLCFGQSSVFEAGAQNMDSVIWEMGDGTQLQGNKVSHSYSADGTFPVTTTLYFQSLSKTILTSTTITKITDPVWLTDIEHCENMVFKIDEFVTDYNYLWNNGNTGPEIKFDTSGRYIIRVESNNCVLNDSLNVRLIDCSCVIFIPNAFTPDANGLNEYFSPSISCDPQRYSMQVFNRWGELLFESSDIQKGWDGTYKNKPCEPGLYLFIVSYSSVLKGIQPTSKGTFLLIR